jgi:DNA segregation ATPase FtsK/SpoIIIE, S-DNA-T family
MRIALTALTPQGPRDVIVRGNDDATVSDISAALRASLWQAERLAEVISLPGAGRHGRHSREPSPGQGGPLWVNARPLDPGAPAIRALHDGALVAADPRASAATALDEPSGMVEVRTVGGPSAGSVHRLGFGTLSLGGTPDCHIRLTGTGSTGAAAQVTVGPGGGSATVTVRPLAGPAQLLLGGEPITGQRTWPFGAVLEIGTNVLTVSVPEQPDAHLSPADDGGLAYNRPPRLLPSGRPRRIEVPAEPKRADKARLQLLSAVIPLVLGLVMVKLLHSWAFAAFMLLSPIMIVGQWVSDRRHGRTSYTKAMRAYRTRLAQLQQAIDDERAADEADRREAAPDPANVLLTATGPRRRLWERRADDPDFLDLRIGLADLPAHIELAAEKGSAVDIELPPPPDARAVPVVLPMPDLGVLGLAGPRSASRGLARWLVAQAAALHSPRDLSIVLLTADPAAAADWDWVRWLPHCAPRLGEDCVALVGTDTGSAARRVAELASLVAERAAMGSGARGGALPAVDAGGDTGHAVLVVLDGARALRRIPGMPQILGQGRAVGVHAICIDDSQRQLPEECAAAVSWDVAQPGRVAMQGGGLDTLGTVLADQVSPAWADRMARALAPVRDVSRGDADATIPAAVRLLDVLRLPDPSPDAIASRWEQGGRTTTAVIGVGADRPFAIDLRADGPHALVAGTTGAGKSELLQTLIASLAVANRPDAMTFVLIDYKGGSAFADCGRLPHTVGVVSDLDGHLTERALASLSAELKRREEILLDAGTKDIEDYWDARRSDRGLEPLPRLVLIIDEFASLVAELPEFVTGLVGIAQRGRSLGVHLILATQRPAGVVSADIRANTNLRIALRVTDPDESTDVIDDPSAAWIAKSTPGRCYVRSGAGSPVPVQSARIGGRRAGTGPGRSSTQVIPVPWQGLGRPLPTADAAGAGTGSAAGRGGPAATADGPDMATDLSVLVDAVRGAAAALGLPAQRSPWLAPLPEVITQDALPPGAAAGRDIPPLAYGLTDLPARQAREPLTLDLAHGGHVVVAGAARSGRSTVLRTIAGAAAQESPADLHIYGIDCGTGALAPLAGLPHCGAVVTRDQQDRMERLLATLRAEIQRRQQLLASAGYAGLAEQRAASAAEAKLPWMLLLFDWWEGYLAAFEQYDYGRLIESLLQILREGPAAGLRCVLTTDRAALIGQVSTVFDQRLVLRLTDAGDAAYAGLAPRTMPAHQPPGRVVFMAGGHALEAQVALLNADPSGQSQVAAIRRLADRARDKHGPPPRAQRPLRVDPLPIRITVTETLRLDPGFTPPSPLWALVGAGGDELSAQGIDLRDEGPGAVVAGPPRSGRSTALLSMTTSLLAAGTAVVVITPRRSPLRALEGEAGVLAVLGASSAEQDLLTAVDGQERYVVVVDDAELMADSMLAEPLGRVLVTGRDADHGLILAGTTADLGRAYAGFVPAALKSRCGVLVAVESPGDGDLFGVRLPRGAGPGPLGRGLLIRPGTAAPVQIAVSE